MKRMKRNLQLVHVRDIKEGDLITGIKTATGVAKLAKTHYEVTDIFQSYLGGLYIQIHVRKQGEDFKRPLNHGQDDIYEVAR